jgi:energy-converting hydrogenase A subunit M
MRKGAYIKANYKLRRRVVKYVTNGSNTDVMETISFLYVSLGSSTGQLHDSLRTADTHAY